jgi:hypothetical protein
LLPLPTWEDLTKLDISKIILCESRNNPVSKGIYMNPMLGDIVFDMLTDFYKCRYFEYQPSVELN